MIELIEKIRTVLQDKEGLFTEIGLTPIKHIDRFRGQPLNPEQFEYYELPALFYGWNKKWEKKGGYYTGEVELTLHLVTLPTWETSNVSTNYEEGLRSILYEMVVHAILDGLESESTGKMIRTEDNEIDTGVVNYMTIGYKLPYYDSATQTEYIEAIVDKLRLSGGLRQKA